jgi:hypothetical protein
MILKKLEKMSNTLMTSVIEQCRRKRSLSTSSRKAKRKSRFFPKCAHAHKSQTSAIKWFKRAINFSLVEA